MKNNVENSKTSPLANRWFALMVLCAAQFLVIMDTSIIGVALPSIQADLGYSSSGLQWIFNAYVIVFGGFLLLGGKLSDVWGPRKVFISGFVLLILSSLFAGLAWSPASLNIGRALQGFGSALIAPSALTLLMTIFTDPKELGKAFGFWGASAAAGGSAGVFLGGLLTEYMDWRWTVLINIPIGIIVIIYGLKLLIPGFSKKSKIDWFGALAITSAISLFVYTLVSVENVGWLSFATIRNFLLSLILLGVFILSQKRNRHALVDLSIFKAKNLSRGNVVMAALAGAWIPLWFIFNLYLQKILGFSAFYSGIALLPMTIMIMLFMMMITGKLIASWGPKKVLMMGLAALTIGLIWFSFVPVSGNYWQDAFGASIISAVGMSLAYIPATMMAMSGASPEQAGLASGIVNTTYQIGSAIGLAIAVAFAGMVTEHTMAAGENAMESMNAGFQSGFMVAGVISLVGLILAGFLKK